MDCHPCSTDIHLSSLCLSPTTQNSILAFLPGISLQLFSCYVTIRMTKILLLAPLLHYMWPCYSFSCLLWCILPVTQTLRREPELCQSLDPFYTRTVKLPFLSKKMLKIIQAYSFQQFFFISSVTFASFSSTQKFFRLLMVALAPFSFFAPYQVSLLGKVLVLILMPFTGNNSCLHWILAGIPG